MAMTFDRLYTVEEHRLLNGVHHANGRSGFRACGGHYESIQPCSGYYLYGECDRPEGGERCGDSAFLSARFWYTHQVLSLAYRRTLERFPDWLVHRWVPMGPGWRKIEFTSPQRNEAEEWCQRLVRQIADNGEVSVKEQLEIEYEEEDGKPGSPVEVSQALKRKSRRTWLVANVPEMHAETMGSFEKAIDSGESFMPSPATLRFKLRRDSSFSPSLFSAPGC